MTLTKRFLSPTFLCFSSLAPARIISFALCVAHWISCVYKIGQFNIEPTSYDTHVMVSPVLFQFS